MTSTDRQTVIDALLQYADMQYGNGDPDKALETLATLGRIDPGNREAAKEAARIGREMKEWAEAA